FSSVAFPFGSPPPSRAATTIARASFENCTPRREATTGFLCLMLAHLDSPHMACVLRPGKGLEAPAATGGPARSALGCSGVGALTSPEIFKAYDIRGLYGEQIDGELAQQIGRAFAHVLGGLAGKPVAQLRVGLGHDMRLSAPELAARYREGL